MKVEVVSHTVQPKYSLDDAQKLVDEANELHLEADRGQGG